MRLLFAILSVITALSTPVFAQDDDKGYITRLLEDSLAGEGRTVQINGFKGALSRRATVDSIIILDAEGQWLKLEDIALQLNRSALLRGRVEVEELNAEIIELSRLPISPESDLPPAEAQGFSLPELPVSIDIKSLRASKIILGEPVLGEAAELEMTATLSLIGGEALAKLTANRTDGKRGTFTIDAGFQGDNQIVALNINLDEGEGGIAAHLLNLPDAPSTKLAIQGNGPLDDLETEINIATDGEDRLTGTIRLTAVASTAENTATSRRFDADISGDVTALFAPQYRPFFGENITLTAEGQQSATGTLELSSLDLKTAAVELSGQVKLNRDYWPTQLDLSGRIGNAAETMITLPVSGDPVKLRQAQLSVQFDHTQGDQFIATFEVDEFETTSVKVAKSKLTAGGTLDGKVDAIGQVIADLDLKISGVDLNDPSLMAAVGDTIDGQLKIDFAEGQPIKLTDLDISGTDFTLSGEARIDDLTSGLNTEFNTLLTASDISRFSGLAGNPLSGAVDISLSGTSDLGGEFDVALSGTANNLKIGQEQADKILNGQTDITVLATRTAIGTRIKNVTIKNPLIDFDGAALLTSEGADLMFKASLSETRDLADVLEGPAVVEGSAKQRDGQWSVDVDASGPFGVTASIDGLATGSSAKVNFDTRLPDIAPLAPGYNGPISLSGFAFASPQGWNVDTNLAGPYDLTAMVKGLVTGPDAKLDFDAYLPEINPLVPQYRGSVKIKSTVKNSSDGWRIDTNLNGPYDLNANVNGRVTGDGAPEIFYSVNLPDIAPLVSKLNGPLDLSGSVNQIAADLWNISTDLNGPSGTRATISGNAGTDGNLNLSINGNAPLALGNPFIIPRAMSGSSRFNLQINGPANLSSISGTIVALDGQFADPTLQIALQNINADITLENARANIDLNGQVSSGGNVSVSGGLGLTDLLNANLQVGLRQVVLEDPTLYRTLLDGDILVRGSLLKNARISGQIDVGETSISVPSSGVSSFGTIPTISHVNATPRVNQTRVKAGLVEKQNQSQNEGLAFPLNITVNAPQKIFVRGRGLDAELSGNLLLTGTTANIISSGQFELTRGRLEVLSERFELDEGIIQLQGDFDPYLRFVATTETAFGTASVIVEGSATDPQVQFESSPEAPQDEILAQIFFGRDVSQISALQALQLANAVATLAGRGGEGIVSKLRRGFNLDDLDITTDEDGNAGLSAGKYISSNIYTDVTVGTQNNAEVSLNIDLTPAITAKGKLGSDRDTSVGIYFEKDY